MDKMTFLFWVIGLQCAIIAGLTVAFLRKCREVEEFIDQIYDLRKALNRAVTRRLGE